MGRALSNGDKVFLIYRTIPPAHGHRADGNFPRKIFNVWLIVFNCLLFSGCDSTKDHKSIQGSAILPSVEIVQVRSGSIALEQRLTGSVKAKNQMQIFSEVSGQIVEIYVNDGEMVKSGDKLLRIRGTEYRERFNQALAGEEIAAARVKQVEVNLMRLETQLVRSATLSERNLISAMEIETAQVNVLSAKADVNMAKAQQRQAAAVVSEYRNALKNTAIRAPISGIIGTRNVEVGQRITDSNPLFVIGDPKEMRVRVTLTESMLSRVSTEAIAIVSSDQAPERRIEAKVSRILPFLNPVTHTTEAEIDIHDPNGFLRPGMYVAVDLIYGQTPDASLIPNSALYQHPRTGNLGVYVVEDPDNENSGSDFSIGNSSTATLNFKPITLVARGRLVSSVEGISTEDWVVTIGHYLLANRAGSEAVVQATDWRHILQLQQVHNRDLLDAIVARDKQTAKL